MRILILTAQTVSHAHKQPFLMLFLPLVEPNVRQMALISSI